MSLSNGDLHLNMCQKAFVARDYTQGLKVQFETTFPEPFKRKISEDTWTFTIDNINARFREAEEVCAVSVFETLMGCFTCYLNRAFAKTRYEQKLLEIAQFLERENLETYMPAGFHILNPMDRGLRVERVRAGSNILTILKRFTPTQTVRDITSEEGNYQALDKAV